ncbi:MAG: class I SAM-dependent RNA methyltransferase [Cyanobacteriota bacterium]
MNEFTLIATCVFGIESIVSDELRNLGFEDLKVENGKITFKSNMEGIALCNIKLRTADRILLKIAEFKAETFDELFDETEKINWHEFIPENSKMHVNGKSIKSTLFSVPNCQGIVKKAIIENMKKKYKKSWFEETGSVFKIEISLLKDIATITIDTTGPSLHKRGYREEAGDAPLKETLASALIILSRWAPSRVLADPFCGSGTIPIEAAMIAKNIAPGINRHFSAEEWEWFPKKIWDDTIEKARSEEINDVEFRILGSDIDYHVLKKAKQNAKNADLEDCIAFQKMDVSQFGSRKKFGCMISNPPYGERLGELEEVEALYETMGYLYKSLDHWSFYTLTANKDFERLFGRRADKNRKLYNGNIQCYFYQHY